MPLLHYHLSLYKASYSLIKPTNNSLEMSSKKRHYDLKFLFRTLLLLACLWFFILGVLYRTTTISPALSSPRQDSKHVKTVMRGDNSVHSNFTVNKRRVPNGPDPIHNSKEFMIFSTIQEEVVERTAKEVIETKNEIFIRLPDTDFIICISR